MFVIGKHLRAFKMNNYYIKINHNFNAFLQHSFETKGTIRVSPIQTDFKA